MLRLSGMGRLSGISRLSGLSVALATLVVMGAPMALATPAGALATLAIGGDLVVAIDPATLGMQLRSAQGDLAIAAPGEATAVEALAVTPEKVSWRQPARGLAVTVQREGAGIRVRFETDKAQTLTWPRTGADPRATALGLPAGGGLHIPAGDAFWRSRLVGDELEAANGLTFPAWSVEAGAHAVTYVLPEDLHTVLTFSDPKGKLVTEAQHEFRVRDGLEPFELLIAVGPAHPLAAARAYRQFLDASGRFVPFARKVAASPDAARLLGATHAYLWGDGRRPALLDKLRALGVDRMWLGYDQDEREGGDLVRPDFVKRAKAQGHLVGPYLTLDNIQAPATADTPQSVYDQALYKTGGIVRWDGKKRTGFSGRGYELSSEALRRAKHDWIGERIRNAVATGMNAPFLDCDGFGQYYDDFDPAHPMTQTRDRENRRLRMDRMGQGAHLVLGSETGVAWAVPSLHFAHGAHAIPGDELWALLGPKGKQSFGSWGPTERPRIFFQEATVDAATARTLYEPRLRVPLYQAVFHDAIITTDRWEFSPVKLKGMVRQRLLLELLYLQPSVWNLDAKALVQHGARLAAVHRFFAPLHRAFGTARLEDFSWLRPDHTVQRTQFTGGLVLTANFGPVPAEGVPPLAIEARWPDGHRQVFKPAP